MRKKLYNLSFPYLSYQFWKKIRYGDVKRLTFFDENITDAETEALENEDFDRGETFCVCD